MGTTTNRGLPFPEGTDDPDVPDDVQSLAEALDTTVLYDEGTLAGRPAGSEGDVYWATDGGEDSNGGLYYKNSTIWVLVGPKTVVVEADIQSSAVTPNKIATDAVTTAKILNANVTAAKLEAGIQPSGSAAPGDEALRAIGATGDTVVAGDDSRLSAGAAGSATVRALGTSSTEAAAGNDIRITSPFGAIRSAVRSVSRSNVNVASAPSTINGVSPSVGDPFLLVGQTDATENGIWDWQGTSSAMTRSTDFDATSELMRGVLVTAIEGTAGVDAGTTWMLTSSGTLTLDSSDLDWQAVAYQGYGATGSKPSATLIAAGGQYLDTTTGAVNYSTGSAWTKFAQVASGMCFAHAGATAPSFYLLAYGQSLSTTTYADLFAAIGYQFGGSGANFNAPDFRGVAPVGLDDLGGASANTITAAWADTLGGTGGLEDHALTYSEVAEHTHTGPSHTHTGPSHTHTVSITTNTTGSHGHTGSTGGPSGTTNAQSGSGKTLPTSGHSHSITADGDHSHSVSGSTVAGGTGNTGAAGTGNTGSTLGSGSNGTAHNNIQPSMAMTWIIKT